MDTRTLLGQAVYALQHGDHSTAAQLANQVLAVQPNEANSLQILGNINAQQGQHQRALEYYEQGLKSNPNHVHLLNFAGLSAKHLNRLEIAKDYFSRAMDADPRYFHAVYNLGNLYKSEYQFRQAESCLRQAIAIAPQFIAAKASLAGLLEQTHHETEAAVLCQQVLSADPNNYAARLTLANIAMTNKHWTEVKSWLAPVLDSGQLSPVNYAVALGLVAQAEEKQSKYSQAFALFSRANQTLQQVYQQEYQSAQSIYAPAQVESLLAYLEKFEVRRKAVNTEPKAPHRRPVFLVGFPRSGTTLLDQVLSSHADICVLEEKENLAFLYAEYGWQHDRLDTLFNLSEQERQRLQQRYWQEIEQQGVAADSKVVVDKLPLNLIMLAHIYCVFPDAQIIFAIREPRDSVISCFQQRFQMNRAMYEMLSLEGAARYYDLVMRYAVLALEKLPLEQLRVKYEDVVDDLEQASKAVARFLGLEWQAEMLEYQNTAIGRAINTPSAKQVIQPLYKTSQQKYKHYEHAIIDSPAYAALSSWSCHWGYEA